MKSSIKDQPGLLGRGMRHAWLGIIPALAILCLAAASNTESSAGYVENNAPQLEGSWMVTVTPVIPGETPPSFQALVSHTAGGVTLSSDTSQFPAYPMTTAYHGAWVKKGGRNFAFTMTGYQYDNVLDATEDGLYRFEVKEKLTMNPGGDSYNGTATGAWYDLNGTLLVSFPLATHGTRIKAE